MGLQGRYIYWAAATALLAILGFAIAYISLGFLFGLSALGVILVTGIVLIFVKQRKGLHSKKEDKGIFIYAYGKSL